MKLILKKLGTNIVRIRKAKGYSQDELADKAGLHRAYIGHIERGEKNITVFTLFKISKALEIDISELFK